MRDSRLPLNAWSFFITATVFSANVFTDAKLFWKRGSFLTSSLTSDNRSLNFLNILNVGETNCSTKFLFQTNLIEFSNFVPCKEYWRIGVANDSANFYKRQHYDELFEFSTRYEKPDHLIAIKYNFLLSLFGCVSDSIIKSLMMTQQLHLHIHTCWSRCCKLIWDIFVCIQGSEKINDTLARALKLLRRSYSSKNKYLPKFQVTMNDVFSDFIILVIWLCVRSR